jgi:hypothetical protein
MPHNNLSDQEIRLEILRLVKETGSEVQKNNPCQLQIFIINGLIVRQFARTLLTRRNRL